MGWEVDTYKAVYEADVVRDDLEVHFHRLYTDARDEMSDSIKPSWSPVDDFIITITKMETKVTERPLDHPLGQVVIRETSREVLDRFEVRTRSKKAANYIWFLAKKAGAAYETLKQMEQAHQFI